MINYSAVTALPTKLIYIEISELKKHLTKELIQDIHNGATPYPDNEIIREIYFQKKAWKNYKKKFFNRWSYD